MATYAISDVHGRLDELNQLLTLIDRKDDDEIVFLGDYIDRGQQSKEVVTKLIEMSRNEYGVHLLKGNHEVMAIEAMRDPTVLNSWLHCGGQATVNSYRGHVMPSHLHFFKQLKGYHETEHDIFVHAALAPDTPLHAQSEAMLYWEKLTYALNHQSNKKIYCGHTTQESGYPVLLGAARCIDCAGWLTAIRTSDDTVYQVNRTGEQRVYLLKSL